MSSMTGSSVPPAWAGEVGPGRRRVDVVLDERFVSDLEILPIEELRWRRHEADQEETDLSYVRRILHGHIDIVQAELERRSGGGPLGSLVEELPAILSDERPLTPRGSGRLLVIEPSRAEEHRRRVEALVADVDIADVSARTDDELRAVLAAYESAEREVSAVRRRVQVVMDICGAEMARRYRDGEANVDDLLASEGGVGRVDQPAGLGAASAASVPVEGSSPVPSASVEALEERDSL